MILIKWKIKHYQLSLKCQTCTKSWRRHMRRWDDHWSALKLRRETQMGQSWLEALFVIGSSGQHEATTFFTISNFLLNKLNAAVWGIIWYLFYIISDLFFTYKYYIFQIHCTVECIYHVNDTLLKHVVDNFLVSAIIPVKRKQDASWILDPSVPLPCQSHLQSRRRRLPV